MVWLAQCAGVSAVLIISTAIFNIIFGSIWLFIVIAEDLTNDMAAFNNNIVKIIQKNHDRDELMGRFREIIQNYTDAKQLVSFNLKSFQVLQSDELILDPFFLFKFNQLIKI